MFNFIQRYYFSIGNYRKPFIVSIIVVIIDVPLSFILKETSLQVAGLGLANSIAFTMGAVILLQSAWKDISGIDKPALFSFVKRISILVVFLGLVFWSFNLIIESIWHFDSSWINTLILVVLLSTTTATTLLSYRVLKLGWWRN